MARFELLRGVEFQNGDGSTSRLDVIVDLNQDKTVKLHGDDAQIRSGYTRHKGQQLVATFGKDTPIFSGTDDDIYYAHEDFFDGTWTHGGKSSRGVYHYHTDGSFFKALENFARDNKITAIP